MKLLLVEDDEWIADMIRRGLEKSHFVVDVAHDGRTGLRLARDAAYALIILDVMLPGIDGIKLCETLREEHDRVPILMLTARDAVADRVHGLDMGADDYLTKPFDFSELVARIHALLRRDKAHKTRVIRIADMEIDTRMRRVTRGGQEIGLTPREYTLLEALAVREGEILTRDIIQEQVWMDDESYSNTVDVRIGQLRKKVDASSSVKLIHTVHGIGYTLRVPKDDL